QDGARGALRSDPLPPLQDGAGGTLLSDPIYRLPHGVGRMRADGPADNVLDGGVLRDAEGLPASAGVRALLRIGLPTAMLPGDAMQPRVAWQRMVRPPDGPRAVRAGVAWIR